MSVPASSMLIMLAVAGTIMHLFFNNLESTGRFFAVLKNEIAEGKL